jgi:ribulose-5-phosphate 4-epimerase/fuculose-1-phosphate aldolase
LATKKKSSPRKAAKSSSRKAPKPSPRKAAKPQRRDAALQALIEDLVAANHILADQQVLDGYGHVSARHPGDPSRFLLSRSLAPELVTAADIIEYDLDSNAQNGELRPSYLERFIHGEIYRARPDVLAVVHSHSPAVVPFCCSSVRLRPLFHMAGFIRDGASVFDIKTRFGATDMLVRNREQGVALAEVLGEHSVALMRGHGFVAVAHTLPMAVYRAVYTQVNAALQESAISLGGVVTYLDPDEGALAEASQNETVQRPWQLWRKRVTG